jgi:hypothetical protein
MLPEAIGLKQNLYFYSILVFILIVTKSKICSAIEFDAVQNGFNEIVSCTCNERVLL